MLDQWHRRAAVAGALVLAILLPTATLAELIVNGSFESFSGGTLNPSFPDRFMNGGSDLTVTGWDFSSDPSADIFRGLNAPGAISGAYRAADGNYFAGGTTGNIVLPMPGEGFSQTVTVAPSMTYELRFAMAPGGLYNGITGQFGAWDHSAKSGWKVTVTGAVVTEINQLFITTPGDIDPNIQPGPTTWTDESVLFQSDAGSMSPECGCGWPELEQINTPQLRFLDWFFANWMVGVFAR